MSVFVVSRVKIIDADGMADYFKAAPATVSAFGGDYQVRTSDVTPLEGDWSHERMVVLKFPDTERARAWYVSPAYRPLRDLRQRCATAEIMLVPGDDG